jgi:hypothetical protein
VFEVGDEVEVIAGDYIHTKVGARGVVLEVLERNPELYINFDVSTLHEGLCTILPNVKFYINMKNVKHVGSVTTPHSKIIHKIKQLDEAFAKRQQTKRESVCV